LEGIESHGGPVAALAFSPGGEELVSSGVDGSICLWDLRPDSCYVSSIVATVGKRKGDTEKGCMDPAVACGGRLYPYIFGTHQEEPSPFGKRHRSRRHKASSLAIVQDGSRNTTTLFATHSSTPSRGQIAAYSLFKNEENSCKPDAILHGHLHDVTCLTPIVGAWDNLRVGRYKDGSNTRLLSAGKDDIILSWGIPSPKSDSSETSLHSEIDKFSSNTSHILSILKQQRAHQLERRHHQYQAGSIGGREWYTSINDDDLQPRYSSVDIDSW
jgi:WD40 repeat protein